MKFKTTKKEMLENAKVISAPFCALQSLLSHKYPVAYTSGTDGWNCDIYDIGYNWYIATGYRPFGNVSVDIDIINDIERRAEETIKSDVLDYYGRMSSLDCLIEELKNHGGSNNELHCSEAHGRGSSKADCQSLQ